MPQRRRGSARLDGVARPDAAQTLKQKGQSAGHEAPYRIGEQDRDDRDGHGERTLELSGENRGEDATKDDGEHRVGEPGKQQGQHRVGGLAQADDGDPEGGDDESDDDWHCGRVADIELMLDDTDQWPEQRECSKTEDEGPLQGVDFVHANNDRNARVPSHRPRLSSCVASCRIFTTSRSDTGRRPETHAAEAALIVTLEV